MNADTEATHRDLDWLKTLISDNVMLIAYLALAAFVGHRSLGLPDFGITPLYLFTIGVVGALAIWVGTIVARRRARNRLVRGLRGNGFTEDEIAEQVRSADADLDRHDYFT